MSPNKDEQIELVGKDTTEMAARRVLTKTFEIKQDSVSKQLLFKRAHDVTSALRALRFAVESLQSGYHFDDGTAAAKIESMDKAVGVLERESALLNTLYLDE